MKTDVTIMYSGGLDSLVAYHYAMSKKMTPLCLHVNLGQPYAEKELRSINGGTSWHPTVNILNMTDLYSLISMRISNHIIPSRNVMFAVIGSMFSPRVWINALDGEQNGKEHDKSEKFFDDATLLLTFTNDFFQPATIIESPFITFSKAETIKWALDYGLPLEVLFNTSSCYDNERPRCGKCLACVKRYIAFLENDIQEPGYDANPLESDYFKELCIEIPKAVASEDFSRFTKKRAYEFLALVERRGLHARI